MSDTDRIAELERRVAELEKIAVGDVHEAVPAAKRLKASRRDEDAEHAKPLQ